MHTYTCTQAHMYIHTSSTCKHTHTHPLHTNTRKHHRSSCGAKPAQVHGCLPGLPPNGIESEAVGAGEQRPVALLLLQAVDMR